MHITMQPAEKKRHTFFYSFGQTRDTATGCIGHVRGDFGDGFQFCTSWWPHQEELSTPKFRKELDALLETLRTKHGLLKNFALMSCYCRTHPEAKLSNSLGNTYGYEFISDDYVYYIRLLPQKEKYNFYCYCYLREELEKYISTTEALKSL